MSSIRIVCTGTKRAAHRELLIAKLTNIGGHWCETTYEKGGEPGEYFVTTLEQRVDADGRYPLLCRRCPRRNARVTPDRLEKALDALAAAGFEQMNLSDLEGC